MELAKFIATIATPIAIGVGFWFARRQLQSTRNARMAQAIIDLHNVWNSSKLQESRCRINKAGSNFKVDFINADKENSPDLYVLVEVANFFDTLGLLVMQGLIDKRVAYEQYWRAEEHYYQLYRQILEDSAYKDYFECFVKLHKVFEKERTKYHKEKPRPSI